VPVRRIDQDHTRFRQIVRGRIKQDLKRFVSSGELIGKQGQRYVTIPLPHITLPRFRFGDNQKAGRRTGEGANGQPCRPARRRHRDGRRARASTCLEVDVSLEELRRSSATSSSCRRSSRAARASCARRRQVHGHLARRAAEPAPLQAHVPQALKRMIASGTYDPDPAADHADPRGRPLPGALAAPGAAGQRLDHLHDGRVGSMGREQKEIVRMEAFWIDTWLRHQYKNLEVNYIVHDAVAHIVDQHTFFHLRSRAGPRSAPRTSCACS
jgi:uncharacterized sporulation protein YeaH/YhbH (DUF444 family)